MGGADPVEQWAFESILRPVLADMLEPHERHELRLSYVDHGHTLLAEITVDRERFGVFLVTRDADFETDAELRTRVASELQDEFATSSFAWGTMRTYGSAEA